MSKKSKSPEAPESIDKMVSASLCNLRQGIRRRYQETEDKIRESPTASLVGAVGVGYLLRRMPVRAILLTQVRVVSALAPPALFLFGAAKAFGILKKQQSSKGG